MENNFFYITSIYLFSALISFFTLTFILPKLYKTQKPRLTFNKKIFFGIFLLSILTFMIGTFSFLLVEKLDYKKGNIDISETINELSVKADIEILKRNKAREDKIFFVVQEYLKANQSKNVNRIDTFYSFPLEKFFKLLHVSKDKLNERTRFEWRHKTYPLFKINSTNTIIKTIGIDTVKVVIKQFETENRTIFLNIKLNKELKIFSIGNSILTNYYGKDEEDSIINN